MRVSLATLALSGLLAVPASGGEQVIEFRYVIHPLEVKTFEAPKIEGQTMVMGKVFGVVAFKDGRVGTKDFIYQAELLNGDGPIYGFSTYRFEDGSSITASFAGEIKGRPAARGLCDPVGHRSLCKCHRHRHLREPAEQARRRHHLEHKAQRQNAVTDLLRSTRYPD